MDATGSAAGELREMAMQTKLAIYALAVTLAAIAAAGNRERTDANGRWLALLHQMLLAL
jgi:hypothetical protein